VSLNYCRKRSLYQHCLGKHTRLSYRGSNILNVVIKSLSKDKRVDNGDEGEVISPEVYVGPANNETHPVRFSNVVI